jgi:hypothetical protein
MNPPPPNPINKKRVQITTKKNPTLSKKTEMAFLTTNTMFSISIVFKYNYNEATALQS